MTNSHCIVVGFGPGVGFGIAQAFANTGFNLSLITRNLDKVRAQLDDLKRHGIAVESIAANADNADALQKAIHEARTRLGPPAVLNYNVAARSPGKQLKVTGVLVGILTIMGAVQAGTAFVPQDRACISRVIQSASRLISNGSSIRW